MYYTDNHENDSINDYTSNDENDTSDDEHDMSDDENNYDGSSSTSDNESVQFQNYDSNNIE